MDHASTKFLPLSIKHLFYGVLLILAFSANSKAEVYKWVDAQGNTHYSDIKPNEINSEKIRIKTHHNNSNQRSPQTAASELSQRNEQALQEKSKALKEATEKRELEAQCEAIKNNLKTIEENSRIQVNENGQIRFLNQDEIAAKKESYRQQIKEHCTF